MAHHHPFSERTPTTSLAPDPPEAPGFHSQPEKQPSRGPVLPEVLPAVGGLCWGRQRCCGGPAVAAGWLCGAEGFFPPAWGELLWKLGLHEPISRGREGSRGEGDVNPAAASRSYLGIRQRQIKLLEGEGWLRPRKKRYPPFLGNFHFQPAGFGCLIPNLWGSPADTHHPRRRNYPCRDETIPVYFSSLNYCEGRTRWQRSGAEPVPCRARTGHSTIPVSLSPTFLLTLLSASIAFVTAGIQDTGQLCVVI